jgi:Holliday junction resolvase
MPNYRYLRSRRREQQWVLKLRAQGFDAARSAGSKSPWDVWAFNTKTKKLILVQIKTKKGARLAKVKNPVLYTGVEASTLTLSYE